MTGHLSIIVTGPDVPIIPALPFATDHNWHGTTMVSTRCRLGAGALVFHALGTLNSESGGVLENNRHCDPVSVSAIVSGKTVSLATLFCTPLRQHSAT